MYRPDNVVTKLVPSSGRYVAGSTVFVVDRIPWDLIQSYPWRSWEELSAFFVPLCYLFGQICVAASGRQCHNMKTFICNLTCRCNGRAMRRQWWKRREAALQSCYPRGMFVMGFSAFFWSHVGVYWLSSLSCFESSWSTINFGLRVGDGRWTRHWSYR